MSDSIDTSIDASAEEVHAAADWLDKVRTGLTDAENGLCDFSTYQEVSGELGDTVKEYAQSLSDACSSASEELILAGGTAAAAAGWAYEKWGPLRTREKIDEGMRDAWDATADKAEDAWDWTKDKATSAWKSVFG